MLELKILIFIYLFKETKLSSYVPFSTRFSVIQ